MKVRIDRRVRRHLNDAGGLLTLEARAKTGCMVTRQVEARVGKPDDPDAYLELEVGGITVFVQGTIEQTTGPCSLRPAPSPRSSESANATATSPSWWANCGRQTLLTTDQIGVVP